MGLGSSECAAPIILSQELDLNRAAWFYFSDIGGNLHLASSDRGFTLSVVRMDAVFDLNRSSYLNLNNSFTAKTIF